MFYGHRPNKLGGYDWNSIKNKNIRDRLFSEVAKIMNNTEDNNFRFISGGALGVDQFAFDVVHNIKYHTLKLNQVKIINEVAIPFSKQACKWQYEDVKRYEIQLSQADKCTYVDRLDDYKIKGYQEEIYYPAKMQKRNEYMVDSSDIVIAVWDYSKGGTANCVNYARKKNKQIVIINPSEI